MNNSVVTSLTTLSPLSGGSKDINGCTRNPCQHGTCVNKDGGYNCTCSPGWTGLNCQFAGVIITAGRCPSGWREYNNHCYKLVRDQISWHTANQECKLQGAKLTYIKSPGENNFIANLTSNAEILGNAVWIGLHRRRSLFSWTDGSLLTYKNWAPGAPGNLYTLANIWDMIKKKTYNCGAMYSRDKEGSSLTGRGHKRGQWNNNNCRGRFPYVCKRQK